MRAEVTYWLRMKNRLVCNNLIKRLDLNYVCHVTPIKGSIPAWLRPGDVRGTCWWPGQLRRETTITINIHKTRPGERGHSEGGREEDNGMKLREQPPRTLSQPVKIWWKCSNLVRSSLKKTGRGWMGEGSNINKVSKINNRGPSSTARCDGTFKLFWTFLLAAAVKWNSNPIQI